MSDKSLIVKCKLRDDEVERYNQLQNILGIESNAETIRTMLDISLKNVSPDTFFMEISPEIYTKLSGLLQRPEIQRKLNISNPGEYIRMILLKEIKELQQEAKSLIHWEVKKHLPPFDKEIANAIAQLQQSVDSGVTDRQIAKVLEREQNDGKIDTLANKISEVLEKYYEKGYLEKDIDHEGITIYYAPN